MDALEISDVYAAFEGVVRLCLAHYGGEAGGRLLFYALADRAGAATALGASIAGAASLGVDPDRERLKAALRSGACDFVVNNLDEAVRILKNEIRKKQPVAVGLVGAVGECVAAMLERGLQPDLVAASVGDVNGFGGRGARVLPSDRGPQYESDDVWWSVFESPARWLPQIDALAVETLGKDSSAKGNARLLWLRKVPLYLGRASEHFVPMSAGEAELFAAAVDGLQASLPVAISVRRGVQGRDALRTGPSLMEP